MTVKSTQPTQDACAVLVSVGVLVGFVPMSVVRISSVKAKVGDGHAAHHEIALISTIVSERGTPS